MTPNLYGKCIPAELTKWKSVLTEFAKIAKDVNRNEKGRNQSPPNINQAPEKKGCKLGRGPLTASFELCEKAAAKDFRKMAGFPTDAGP